MRRLKDGCSLSDERLVGRVRLSGLSDDRATSRAVSRHHVVYNPCTLQATFPKPSIRELTWSPCMCDLGFLPLRYVRRIISFGTPPANLGSNWTKSSQVNGNSR